MKILIIDDSNAKITALSDVVLDLFPDCKVVTRRSFHSGLKELESGLYSLVLLDMTVPTTERDDGRFEGRIRHFGGRELLGEMELLSCSSKAIVVTQFDRIDDGIEVIEFDDLARELRDTFSDSLIGTVFYSSISVGWVDEIKKLIRGHFCI